MPNSVPQKKPPVVDFVAVNAAIDLLSSLTVRDLLEIHKARRKASADLRKALYADEVSLHPAEHIRAADAALVEKIRIILTEVAERPNGTSKK